jgi:hypothetical protein
MRIQAPSSNRQTTLKQALTVLHSTRSKVTRTTRQVFDEDDHEAEEDDPIVLEALSMKRGHSRLRTSSKCGRSTVRSRLRSRLMFPWRSIDFYMMPSRSVITFKTELVRETIVEALEEICEQNSVGAPIHPTFDTQLCSPKCTS